MRSIVPANSDPLTRCPHTPTARQQAFLGLTCLEAFFGGACGGGKSDALLMAALQYVHVPGYAALILRKDTQRLSLAGGLIPRSHAWLAESGAKWNADRRTWSFPTKSGPPATLSFGFLAHPLDKYRYQSSEFQFIAFDELTELAEEDYLFLFSRLRRPKDMPVPLRIRAASNPGNVGHLWVKQRFVAEGQERGLGLGARASDPEPAVESASSLSSPALAPSPSPTSRAFIPSRIADNPFLDEAEYRRALLHLPPLARERLMNGDWSVSEQGLIQAEWLRYYVEASGQLELLDPAGRMLAVVQPDECRKFITVDPAGTSADKTREARGRAASWTVAQVWLQPRRELSRFLLLRHQVREQVAFEGLCKLIRDLHGKWKPERIWIENEKFGQAAVSVLKHELPIFEVPTQCRDKATRAAPLSLKFERGEIFLPKYETIWRPGFEAELLAWTGHENEPADQIDAAAYAAIVSQGQGTATLRILPVTTIPLSSVVAAFH